MKHEEQRHPLGRLVLEAMSIKGLTEVDRIDVAVMLQGATMLLGPGASAMEKAYGAVAVDVLDVLARPFSDGSPAPLLQIKPWKGRSWAGRSGGVFTRNPEYWKDSE
jgi:hypothetical protein